MNETESNRTLTVSKLWALAEFAGLPARGFATLLRRFGTLDGIYGAEIAEIQEALDGDEDFARRISEVSERLPEAEVFIQRLPDLNIKTVTLFDSEYPQGLFELNDPPPILFYRGALPQSGQRLIAFVGCSEPDADGIAVSVDFTKRLAGADISLVTGIHRGVNIVSLIGATGGADSEGEEPAKRTPSYAVAASGLEVIEPEEYAALAESVAAEGGVLSEHGPQVEPSPERYCEANRLLVAISGAVVIGPFVSESSGTFDVAEACIEQGKILFVLVADQQEEVDRAALERVVSLGAIPISYPNDFESIAKCLV